MSNQRDFVVLYIGRKNIALGKIFREGRIKV